MQADDVRMTLSEIEKLRAANAMLEHENRVLRARVSGLLAANDELKKHVIHLRKRLRLFS